MTIFCVPPFTMPRRVNPSSKANGSAEPGHVATFFMLATFRLPDAGGEKLGEVTDLGGAQAPIACATGLVLLAPLYWAVTKRYVRCCRTEMNRDRIRRVRNRVLRIPDRTRYPGVLCAAALKSCPGPRSRLTSGQVNFPFNR